MESTTATQGVSFFLYIALFVLDGVAMDNYNWLVFEPQGTPWSIETGFFYNSVMQLVAFGLAVFLSGKIVSAKPA
jgi:hypothetical protein